MNLKVNKVGGAYYNLHGKQTDTYYCRRFFKTVTNGTKLVLI